MSDEVRDPFKGGGGPPIAKFTDPGDSIEGKITKVEYRQATDVHGKIKRFADGNPMPLVILTLDTADGEMRDFVQGRSISQLRGEVFSIHGPDTPPQIGASYKRTLTGIAEPTAKGLDGEKLFDVEYSADDDGNDDRELV